MPEAHASDHLRRLDECLHWLVRRYYIRRFTVGSLRSLGAAEAFALACLGRASPTRMTDLSHATGIPLSTLTGVVDRLVARGYAERAHGAEDRREVIVSLTGRGRRAQREYLAVRQEVCAGMVDALECEEADRVVAALERIRRRVEERNDGRNGAGARRADG